MATTPASDLPEHVTRMLEKRLKSLSKHLVRARRRPKRRSPQFCETKRAQMRAYHSRKRELETEVNELKQQLADLTSKLEKTRAVPAPPDSPPPLTENTLVDATQPRVAPPNKKRNFGFGDLFQRPSPSDSEVFSSASLGAPRGAYLS